MSWAILYVGHICPLAYCISTWIFYTLWNIYPDWILYKPKTSQKLAGVFSMQLNVKMQSESCEFEVAKDKYNHLLHVCNCEMQYFQMVACPDITALTKWCVHLLIAFMKAI